MSEPTREVFFRPAYDKSAEGCGVHGVDAVFALRGPEGVVEFELYTNWQLRSVRREMDGALDPDPAYLRYHSQKSLDDDMGLTDSCEYLGGEPCYWGAETLGAESLFDVLLEKGSEGVWENLEEYYKEVFG